VEPPVEAVQESATGLRDDAIVIKGSEGAISLELMPLREGITRAFLRFSPRNLNLSGPSVKRLSDELCARPYSKILVQDSKHHILARSLGSSGWRVGAAIDPSMNKRCSLVTTYDIPIDENLRDSNGAVPDISSTSELNGIQVDISERKAWAFYTDDGETARVVSEGPRKQGLMVAEQTDDLFEAGDCLVRYLAASKKSWAVFSTDLGRFVRKFDPTTMWRMVLDRPVAYDHRCEAVSSRNRSQAVKLFSEYYDESTMQSMLRLRRYRIDRNYSIHMVQGGFVITRLEGDTGLVYDIYVTPSRQGEGLGSELMRCALTDLSGKVSSCYLHTSYPRAKRLYEKFGFRSVYSQLGIRLDELALEPPSAK
jgi:ribosomal protein S18 acetylase RimI-like enzyme